MLKHGTFAFSFVSIVMAQAFIGTRIRQSYWKINYLCYLRLYGLCDKDVSNACKEVFEDTLTVTRKKTPIRLDISVSFFLSFVPKEDFRDNI